MVPFFGVVNCLDCLGRSLGANILNIVEPFLGASDASTVTTITLLLALLFFSFIWLGFKQFSFCQAIRGVEPAENVVAPIALEEPGKVLSESEDTEPIDLWEAKFGTRCRELADAAQLTPREAEIFSFLARGRNAGFIMESLSITRNTAKAHIGHIYNKLGIHSHQELLSLMEEK